MEGIGQCVEIDDGFTRWKDARELAGDAAAVIWARAENA